MTTSLPSIPTALSTVLQQNQDIQTKQQGIVDQSNAIVGDMKNQVANIKQATDPSGAGTSFENNATIKVTGEQAQALAQARANAFSKQLIGDPDSATNLTSVLAGQYKQSVDNYTKSQQDLSGIVHTSFMDHPIDWMVGQMRLPFVQQEVDADKDAVNFTGAQIEHTQSMVSGASKMYQDLKVTANAATIQATADVAKNIAIQTAATAALGGDQHEIAGLGQVMQMTGQQAAAFTSRFNDIVQATDSIASNRLKAAQTNEAGVMTQNIQQEMAERSMRMEKLNEDKTSYESNLANMQAGAAALGKASGVTLNRAEVQKRYNDPRFRGQMEDLADIGSAIQNGTQVDPLAVLRTKLSDPKFKVPDAQTDGFYNRVIEDAVHNQQSARGDFYSMKPAEQSAALMQSLASLHKQYSSDPTRDAVNNPWSTVPQGTFFGNNPIIKDVLANPATAKAGALFNTVYGSHPDQLIDPSSMLKQGLAFVNNGQITPKELADTVSSISNLSSAANIAKRQSYMWGIPGAVNTVVKIPGMFWGQNDLNINDPKALGAYITRQQMQGTMDKMGNPFEGVRMPGGSN